MYSYNLTDPNPTTASSTTRDSDNSESPSSSATSSSSSPGLLQLQVFIHNARNIHNICIYDDQDVYAKFSFTNYNETFSTHTVRGGGKNPDFNHKLVLKLNHPDSVLKCEVWMFSRIKHLMDDQLLGFTLVPVSMVARCSTGILTEDFSLSSTDLFHSPAGTVRLTLSLHPTAGGTTTSSAVVTSSISSEVVLLENHRKMDELPVEYSRIEFPDINVVRENQQMVSEYFKLAAAGEEKNSNVLRPEVMGESCSFLHLGGGASFFDTGHGNHYSKMKNMINSHHQEATNSHVDVDQSVSPSSANAFIGNSHDPISSAQTAINTPTLKKMKKKNIRNNVPADDHIGDDQSEQQMTNFNTTEIGKMLNKEAEQVLIQQQIVDMYMKSMHQFTESLSKMKLPMDHLSSTSAPAGQLVSQSWDINNDNATITAASVDNSANKHRELEQDKSKSEVHNNIINIIKKDGSNSRVFYGSRAFF